MAKLSDITAAATDADLRDRFISAAAELGIANPSAWVDERSRQLAAASTGSGDDTIASVYAYAVSTRNPPPGVDPAAVTDAHIRHAVSTLEGNNHGQR